MELARVMTSSEFDRDEEEVAMNGDYKQQEDQQQVEKKYDEAQDYDPYGYGDVSSMHIVASLVQSTRNYYSFANYDTTTTKKESSHDMSSSKDRTNITQAYSNYNNTYSTRRIPSKVNSECLSVLTPSSSCNDLNDNNRKNIDNGNRSDGQSSCDDGEGELSSNSISCSERNSLPYSPQPKGEEYLDSTVHATSKGSFLILGSRI